MTSQWKKARAGSSSIAVSVSAAGRPVSRYQVAGIDTIGSRSKAVGKAGKHTRSSLGPRSRV